MSRPGDDRGGVSQDFVFGTLATDDLRLAQLRAASAGVRQALDLDPPDPRPDEPVAVTVRIGPRVRADHVTCYVTLDGTDPSGERGRAHVGEAIALERTAVDWDTLSWAYTETWTATIPPQPSGTLVRYRIEAWSAGGGSTWATEVAGVVAGERPPGVDEQDALILGPGAGPLWPVPRHGSFAFRVDDARVPDWLRDAVIYEVFVDRFATSDGRPFARPATPGGFYGGTLRGISTHLEHISALGATCLWLTPIFPSPSHHGYDATDYRSVEPRLGTARDLEELVAAAHARGLRVILDFAANHCSSDHPAFGLAIADPDSPEAHWFTFTRWPDQYLSFFGVRDLPQIDTDDPGARAYLIESARHWLDLGVDGFRCDYAHGPSHAFWSDFRAATRQTAPESIAIGEVVETPALQRSYRGRLDGCLDFVLLQELRRLFAFGETTPSQFDMFLRRHLEFFGGDLALPSFLDNHDMNRFLWVVGGDTRRLRLAALCQFTLPHPPIVYYGTEVGLSQERDVRYPDGSGHPEEARLPMPWGADQDRALLAFYRELVACRLRTPSLWRSNRQTLVADDATGLYAYRCSDASGEAVVALNCGTDSVTVSLGEHRLAGDAGAHRLALATDAEAAFDGRTLVLPPLAGALLSGASPRATARTAPRTPPAR